MSKSGQSNYRGVNTQAKAAILLFLVNFYESDFDSMTLEDTAWEDFTLSFQSGKRIIAEAKAWNKPLTLNDVINILEGIVPKSEDLSSKDEILIVCNSVEGKATQAIEYLRYDMQVKDIPSLRSYRKPEKLTQEVVNLLKKTKFYELPTSDGHSTDDYLFDETVSRLYQILPMWLPQHEIEKLMSHVLIQSIYSKSERGDRVTKVEFIQYLEDYKRTKISDSGVYDSERRKVTKQVEKIISATNDQDEHYLLEGSNLISLSAQPMQMHIALDLISHTKNLNLESWDHIWRALINRSYAYRVIGILEDNLSNIANAKYTLNFLTTSVAELTSLSMERYGRDHALTLASKAIQLHPELAPEALSFIEAYLKARANVYKDDQSKRDLSYEKENAAKILTGIFDLSNVSKDDANKNKVIELIAQHFNLTDDDGEYLNTSPLEVYKLVGRWLSEDFYSRIHKVISLLNEDFNESRFYNRGFDGWELMGGMESGFSRHFTIHDRGFMDNILIPAFQRTYKIDKDTFWNFLKEEILTKSVKEVSASKPDFISRAAIPVIIDEYLHGDHSEEAFDILKKFLKMRKGIPDRGRLIFQVLRDLGNVAGKKRWEITKAYLDMSDTKLPPSVFVEDVVLQIATTGDKDVLEYVEAWMNNPAYIDTANRWHFYADTVISRLLGSKNIDAQKKGIEFLAIYLTPAGKWEDGDNTRTWDIAPLLLKTYWADRDQLSTILLNLYDSQETLTKNRQLVITSLFSQQQIKEKADIRFLYSEVIRPIVFDRLNGDLREIVNKFSNHHAREEILKFAEKLMSINMLEEGMELVRIFMDDPNPSLTNEPDDPEGTFNYHRKIIEGKEEIVITTVRGWIPFVLQKIVKVEGQSYLSEIIEINERLLNDNNYYVRFQALILLSGLAKNRHTVVPPARKERFMSVSDAMKIEGLAFDFLENEENREFKPLMERVLYCFNFLRSLNQDNAKRLLLSAKQLSFSEEIDHLSSLYLFFAEFRKGSFSTVEDRKYLGKELYDDLAKYDDKFFKQLLEEEMISGGSEMRRHLAWQFWRLIGDKKDADNISDSEYDRMFAISHHYLSFLVTRYDHSAFEMMFHFIDDNIKKKPSECLTLWKGAVVTEREYLIQNESSIQYHHNWWDRMNTAEMVLLVRSNDGDKEFLKYVSILLSYPQKLQGIHNPRIILDALRAIEKDEAEDLIEKFNTNYPQVYAQYLLEENQSQ